MVIDTSAVVAILFDEADQVRYDQAIEAASVRLVSAVTRVELALVIEGRKGEAGRDRLEPVEQVVEVVGDEALAVLRVENNLRVQPVPGRTPLVFLHMPWRQRGQRLAGFQPAVLGPNYVGEARGWKPGSRALRYFTLSTRYKSARSAFVRRRVQACESDFFWRRAEEIQNKIKLAARITKKTQSFSVVA